MIFRNVTTEATDTCRSVPGGTAVRAWPHIIRAVVLWIKVTDRRRLLIMRVRFMVSPNGYSYSYLLVRVPSTRLWNDCLIILWHIQNFLTNVQSSFQSCFHLFYSSDSCIDNDGYDKMNNAERHQQQGVSVSGLLMRYAVVLCYFLLLLMRCPYIAVVCIVVNNNHAFPAR